MIEERKRGILWLKLNDKRAGKSKESKEIFRIIK
jgi:hypothetical protein